MIMTLEREIGKVVDYPDNPLQTIEDLSPMNYAMVIPAR
jgi:hypothetical protein